MAARKSLDFNQIAHRVVAQATRGDTPPVLTGEEALAAIDYLEARLKEETALVAKKRKKTAKKRSRTT